MRHPEVLIVPVLMLADYFLTLWGAKLAEQGYRKHYKVAHYELNPNWQRDVAQRRWFNPRHLLLTALVSLLTLAVSEFELALFPWYFPFLLGIVVGAFGTVVSRHIGNLFLFEALRRRPDDVSGEVSMKMHFVLTVSAAQAIGTAVLVGLIAAFTQAPFPIGATVGVGAVALAHVFWQQQQPKD